jgi:hypothetical protein
MNLSHFYLNLTVIKSIPLLPFTIIVGLFAVFTLYFFFKWYHSFARARVMQDMPTAKIRSAAQGYVELSGTQKMMPNQPTIATLSRLPCTWYRYTIAHIANKRIKPIEHGESEAPFIVEDETGVCVIYPTGGEISTTLVDTWMGFKRYPNGKPRNWFFRLLGTLGNYQYQEWRMEEGMTLYAIGNFHTQSTDDDNVVNILSKEGLDKSKPFILSGRDQSKIIQMFSWDAFVWFIAYISLFIIVCALLLIRLS